MSPAMKCWSAYDYSSKFPDLTKSQAKIVRSVAKGRNTGRHVKLKAKATVQVIGDKAHRAHDKLWL